jgi:L-fuculose-phosphate aldolase
MCQGCQGHLTHTETLDRSTGMKTEREIRKEAAKMCQLTYKKGLMTSTDGNISVRLRDRILITPSGIHKGFIKPEDFIVTDLIGKKLSGEGNPSQEIAMHIEIYAQRTDVQAVIHAHPIYCIAFTLAGLSFGKAYLPEVVLSVGEIPIVPYSTPTSYEVADNLRSYIARHNAVILDRHGSVTVGKTLFEAFCLLERIEHVAQTLFVARQLGPLKQLTDSELRKLRTGV